MFSKKIYMNQTANKIWVDENSKSFNRSMKSFLQNNDIEMHSTDNKEKSVLAERFIRTLKNRIYKYMTSVSKNVYIDKLDDIINKYNNTYHTIIKMKSIDVKSNTHTLQFGQKKFFWLKKLKILGRGHVINDLSEEEIVGSDYQKELQKANQK